MQKVINLSFTNGLGKKKHFKQINQLLEMEIHKCDLETKK